MLSELIYISKKKPSCSIEDIEDVLKASLAQNGNKDITGVLLYSQKQFMQILEGDKIEILKLYDKIKKDKMHCKTVMVSLSPIKERYFPGCQMVSKEVSDEFRFLTAMTHQGKAEFKALFIGDNANATTKKTHNIFKSENAKSDQKEKVQKGL